ncbi:MAG: YggT family protein [Chromatiales bacterium]|jgi:YggT family protein
MGDGYLSTPAVFLVQVIFGLYVALVMIRFLLQLVRADFYNPVSQFVVKVTSPALNPLRRVIPGYAGVDFASLLLAWILKAIELSLVLAISGFSFSVLGPLVWAIPELVTLVVNIVLIAIVIQAILSWVSPGGYNPAAVVLHSLSEPVLRPVRRLIPPISGIDVSPMIAILGLILLKMLLLPPLKHLTSSPF